MAATKKLGSKNVLLLHYDEILGSTLKYLLEMMDFTPHLALNGEDAAAQIGAGYEPHILMLDLNQHGQAASNALPLLRTLLPALPVLITATRVDRLIQEFVKEHQGVALLAKPFTLAELKYHLAELA